MNPASQPAVTLREIIPLHRYCSVHVCRGRVQHRLVRKLLQVVAGWYSGGAGRLAGWYCVLCVQCTVLRCRHEY